MLRRRFLTALGAPAFLRAQRTTRPPNVVIVLCDDLGYGDLGCYGHPAIRTPNLDRFAAEGVRFTDCYAAAPVCSPSRAGMLTGRVPNRVGVYDWIPAESVMHLSRSETTFAQLLRGAGYATCHSGKWHCNGKFNSPEQPQPGDHGFDHWFSTQNNAAPSHENPNNFVRNGKPAGSLRGYSSTVIVDEAIQWLGGLDRSRPFCLFLCFHSPHEPVATAEEFTRQYPRAVKPGEALYYGNVTQLDHEFGRLMAALDARGARDNTLVFFTSDNGPETLGRYPGAWRSHGSPGPLRGMKLHLYEAGYRVPGIARFPGLIRPGTVSSEPVCGVDIMPTLCELAGVRPPSDRTLDGASIVAALRGGSVQRSTPLHWHYFHGLDRPRSSMRDGDWKVLGAPAQEKPRPAAAAFRPEFMEVIKGMRLDRFELYNLRLDRGEQRELSKEEPKRLKAMAERLTRLHEEVKAEGPDWRTSATGGR